MGKESSFGLRLSALKINAGGRFFIRAGANSLFQLFGMVFGLLVSVVAARWLGASEKGYYDAFVNFASLVCVVSGLSLNLGICSYLKDSITDERISFVFNAQISHAFLVTLCLLSILTLLSYFEIQKIFGLRIIDLFYFCVPSIFFGLLIQNLGALVSIVRSPVLLHGAMAFGKLLCLLAFFFCWNLSVHDTSPIFINVVMNFVIAGSLIYLLRSSLGKSFNLSGSTVLSILKTSLKLHPNTIGNLFLISLIPILLSIHRTLADVACFTLGFQLFTAVTVFGQSAGAVILRSTLSESVESSWSAQRKTVFLIFLFTLLISVLAFYSSPFLVRLIFGADFFSAVGIFRILLLFAPLMSVTIMLQAYWLKLNWVKLFSLVGTLGSMLGTISAFLLVPELGPVGGVISLAVSYTVSVLLHAYLLIKLEVFIRN
jgi:O-antigen/teichoic acid export membrane protein